MKKVNKGILDNDMVISAENVQKMGEIIALTCIKTVIVRSGKDLHYLYKGLLRDMNRSKESDSIKWLSQNLPLFFRAVDIFADLCDDNHHEGQIKDVIPYLQVELIDVI